MITVEKDYLWMMGEFICVKLRYKILGITIYQMKVGSASKTLGDYLSGNIIYAKQKR